MSMNQHPTDKPIISILVACVHHETEAYKVGENDVSKIEPFEKAGQYAHIPYIRVYKNGEVHSEFCQHMIVGVYFDVPESEAT